MRLTAIFLLLLMSANVFAECKRLRIAGAEQWRPFAYAEKIPALQEKGIAFDLVKLIAEDVDIKLDVQLGLPWSRLEVQLDNGELDLLAGMYFSEERDARWLVSESIADETVHIVTLRDNPLHFETVDDLIGKRGVVPRGVSLGHDFDSIRSKVRLVEVRSHEQMYEMLRLDRVDFLVSPMYAAQVQIMKPENAGIEIVYPAINVYDIHLAMSKKSACASKFAELNNAIRNRKRDGSVTRIVSRYFTPPMTKALAR